MKKLLPILLLPALLLISCVKDSIDGCPGIMYLYFNYTYGSANSFFEAVKTDTYISFYKEDGKYRELTVAPGTIAPTVPLRLPKDFADTGDIELVSWTHDEAVDYVSSPDTPLGESYVRLKEITPGSNICRPVDDLLYARTAFAVGSRYEKNDVILSYQRAVCRMRITMIPQTVQGGADSKAAPVIPGADDYTFHVMGTYNELNDNNETGGEQVILAPECYYEESSTNVVTNWFGAFSSKEEPLKVDVFIKDLKVASFDCAPIGVTSVPGSFVDLIIDGHYTNPRMDVKVNGWRVATIISEM